jgi:hypothetical protein
MLRQTPESLEAGREKVSYRRPCGSCVKSRNTYGEESISEVKVARQLAIQTIRRMEPPPTNFPRNLHVGVIVSSAFSGPPISTQLLPASCFYQQIHFAFLFFLDSIQPQLQDFLALLGNTLPTDRRQLIRDGLFATGLQSRAGKTSPP